jgi:hypothetical protein
VLETGGRSCLGARKELLPPVSTGFCFNSAPNSPAHPVGGTIQLTFRTNAGHLLPGIQKQLPIGDLQLAMNSRLGMMKGAPEIVGTADNEVGDQIFNDLVKAGFSQPYPWKLTLVNNDVINASSTAGG